MTLHVLFVFGLVVLILLGLEFLGVMFCEKTWCVIMCIIASLLVVWLFGRWSFKSIVGRQGEFAGQESNLSNNLYCTLTVYVADGEKCAAGKEFIFLNQKGEIL